MISFGSFWKYAFFKLSTDHCTVCRENIRTVSGSEFPITTKGALTTMVNPAGIFGFSSLRCAAHRSVAALTAVPTCGVSAARPATPHTSAAANIPFNHKVIVILLSK